MRIIIKPGGALVLLLALGVLTGLAFLKLKPGAASNGGASAAATSNTKVPTGNKPRKSSSAGTEVIRPDDVKWSLAVQPPAQAKMEEFVAPEAPGGNTHAVHLTVAAVDSAKYWAAQLIKRVPDPIEANRQMEVHLWARSKTSTSVYVVFEEGQSPHASEISKVVSLSPEWKEYRLPFKTTKDHIQVHANFCIKAGITPGEIDISEVRVTDLGKGS